jgi:hypothetical protein
MFIQIVEWLTKFATLLNNAEKLSVAMNRRKLAATLVQLHTLLSRSADNADNIHIELHKVQRDIEKQKDLFFDSLGLLLGDQRQILKELQDLVRNNEALINIYGNNVADEIGYIAGLKVSLIDVITTFALYRAENFWWGRSRDENWIPVSFDLMDVPAFKELFERQEKEWKRLSDSRDSLDEEHFWRDFRHDFQDLLHGYKANEPAHSFFAIKAGKDKKHDAKTLMRLVNQTETLDSARKLRDARDIIGNLLRQHFKIEELF